MSDDAARQRAGHDSWTKPWAVAEVFAGAGSVAHGFARAAGFEVAYLNDIDEYARRTYQANYGTTVRYDLVDVRSVTGQVIKDAADGRPVAGLLGCPPCQGWSAAGQRAANDPRNLLLDDFFRLVAEIKPLFFVMENVPSVADRAELAVAMAALAPDYRTWHGVLNAASYGLPQSRQRTIVIGYHKDTEVQPTPPPPTHGGSRLIWDYRTERLVEPTVERLDALLGAAPRFGAPKHKQYSMREHYGDGLGGLPPFVTVGEAIRDLAPDFAGRLSAYAKRLSTPRSMPRNHHAWGHGPSLVDRMAMVKEGRRPPIEATNNRRYYSQAYARLHRRGLARTITTNFHNPGCGRFLHYQLHRSLTVREAARLQGFRDDFFFIDHHGWQERIVGNAFPPLWAEVIARHVSDQLHAVLAG
ncbi:DNA cytosine methyltransferase [Micromonospora sp. HM134]|uniref:DNA cytosine methyltransferase n=1 Tax=Micromonospora sp. HM134 TaxID=2583243 RepID=UPI001198571D|nr:DNA cytosine methyltransferase [Micromonospora sp. HM134]QDY11131.1 DNA cytosine methyltransferase [Micromonospora sp. HM134]